MAEDFGFVPKTATVEDFGFVPRGTITPSGQNQGGVLPSDNTLEQSIVSSLPFYGATSALKAGYQTGQDVLGNNLAGKGLGAIFGTAMGLGTVANPLVKGANYYTNLAQALGESLAGGNQNLANQTLTGQRPVIPTFNGVTTESTTANFLTDLAAQAANDPVNAAILIAGARSPKTVQALKTLPASIADAATLKGARQAITTRGVFQQPLPAAVTEAIGTTPIEGSADVVPVLKSSILEANGGTVPKNAPPQQLIKTAMDYKINQYKAGLQAAEDQGLAHSTQSLVDAMQTKLEELHPSFDQAQIDTIIKTVKDENPKIFSKPYLSPVEGQKFAVQVNREVNIKNPNRVPKTSEQLNAETALSQELSRQGSEMYQAASGTYDTPNQDYGVLKQAQEGLTGELKSAQGSDAGKTPGGTHIPLTWEGVIGKVAKKVGGRALMSTKGENVVNSFQRILTEGQDRPAAGTIDPSQQQAIIQQYTPAPAAPVIVPANLQQAVQQAVQAAPVVAAPAAPQFSAATMAGLKGLGLKPSDPMYQSLGEKITRAELASKTGNLSDVRSPVLRALMSQQNYRPAGAVAEPAAVASPLEQAIQTSVEQNLAPPQAAPRTVVPIKQYAPEIQAQLDANKQEAAAYRKQVNSDQVLSRFEKDRRLKAFGMRQAAENRQLTGELTAIEAAAKSKRAAGNYIGKQIQVSTPNGPVDAEVIGNPFGRVKVKMKDGSIMTIDRQNIL